jgi:glycerol-3-phosphate acyltransferase PlsY
MTSMGTLAPLAATLVAYLIGSLSFAVIVSRLMGLADPRTYGSNNPGATNVLRSGNKAAAVATLVVVALKG